MGFKQNGRKDVQDRERSQMDIPDRRNGLEDVPG